MRSFLVVFAVLLFTGRSLAQVNATIYPQLSGYLQAERNMHGLLLGKRNGELDVNRFLRLYTQQQANKNPARKRTFMDGPVVFSMNNAEYSRPVPIDQLKRTSNTISTASAALAVMGFAAGIAASVDLYKNKQYWSREPSAVQAYLQSTYRQHDR